MGEITDHEQIKTGIMQFIIMGYEKRINVYKGDNGSIEWKAEKNLAIYDKDFEK